MKTLQILGSIQGILSFLLLFYSIYQLIIWCMAYFKTPEKPKLTSKRHRFMAVIAARNEEEVITGLIESLKTQDYPKNKLDIYVIADNCTDNTAEVSRRAGAIVYERFDESKRSKGYALNWFFEKVLREFPFKYDAFCVFDADNIVAPNFFAKMNNKLCQGEKLAQGYRDIKNPSDNWISGNYAIFYWTTNRLYQKARENIGLAPLINGSGFMVDMSIIREERGWHTETLTEDTEFSLKQIANGRKIAWVHDAIIYDEQPTDFKEAWIQRLRWGVGNIQCLKVCLPQILKAKRVNPIIIDALIYLMGMPIIVLTLFTTVIEYLRVFFMPLRQSLVSMADKFEISILFSLVTIIQALLIVIFEKKKIRDVWKGIITYPIFLMICFAVNVCAFFNMNMSWQRTRHVRNVKINEIT